MGKWTIKNESQENKHRKEVKKKKSNVQQTELVYKLDWEYTLNGKPVHLITIVYQLLSIS